MKRAEWTSDSLVQQDGKLVIIIDQKTTKYHNESIRPGIIIPSILLPCFLCPHGRLFSNRTRILYHSAKIPGQNYSPSHRFSFRTHPCPLLRFKWEQVYISASSSRVPVGWVMKLLLHMGWGTGGP